RGSPSHPPPRVRPRPEDSPMRCRMIPIAVLAVSLPPAAATGQEPAGQSPELKVLNGFVGTWDEVVTQKPAEWTPKGGSMTSVSKKAWVLGGRFVRMEGTWMPEKTEFSSLAT